MSKQPVSAGVQPFPITGMEIPRRLAQRLRREAERVYVVTPFLNDYEFRPLEPLSRLLRQRATEGSRVRLLTTPPPGKGAGYQAKIQVLEKLERAGIEVFVNENLHAKVYLFRHPIMNLAVVGSANLTTDGMEKWVEIALVSYNEELGRQIEAICAQFISRPDTHAFRRWLALHSRSTPGG